MNCNYVPELDKILKEAKDLKNAVKKRAVERLKIEGLDKDERLANPEDAFFNKPEEYAMHKLAYYECFTCKGPFFGGLRDCEMELQVENQPKPEDLVCGLCKSLDFNIGQTTCEKHGEDFIEWKCMYCCTFAIWHCWGTTHFCEPCH